MKVRENLDFCLTPSNRFRPLEVAYNQHVAAVCNTRIRVIQLLSKFWAYYNNIVVTAHATRVAVGRNAVLVVFRPVFMRLFRIWGCRTAVGGAWSAVGADRGRIGVWLEGVVSVCWALAGLDAPDGLSDIYLYSRRGTGSLWGNVVRNRQESPWYPPPSPISHTVQGFSGGENNFTIMLDPHTVGLYAWNCRGGNWPRESAR